MFNRFVYSNLDRCKQLHIQLVLCNLLLLRKLLLYEVFKV